MTWLGKLLGGGLGLVVGGPLGMLLGAALGHYTLDEGQFFSDEERRQGIFFLATFSMLGKLSKADGRVSSDEIEVIEQVIQEQLRLDSQAREFAIKLFTEAKNSDVPFEQYAQQFADEFDEYPEVLSSLIDLLLRVAHADGVLHPEETRLIEAAVQIFDIEPAYHQLKARYSSSNDLDRSYDMLGASREESLADVKKKYRKLAMEYHPDRVQARGVPPELAAAAEERFKEIQQAYDVIERHLANSSDG